MTIETRILWTDAELAEAIETYLYLLRMERAGLFATGNATAIIQGGGGLPRRNDASIRYRMRNISAVIGEFGIPVLKSYPAAEKVGTGVRERIRAMLESHPSFLEFAASSTSTIAASPVDSRGEALRRLAALRVHLDEIERETLGGGHNNPPEPLTAGGLSRRDFDDARADIGVIENELAKSTPDVQVTRDRSDRLRSLGMRVAVWLGQRGTKFADTALVALAPALIVKLSGLMPLLVEALSAVARATPH